AQPSTAWWTSSFSSSSCGCTSKKAQFIEIAMKFRMIRRRRVGALHVAIQLHQLSYARRKGRRNEIASGPPAAGQRALHVAFQLHQLREGATARLGLAQEVCGEGRIR